MIHHQRCYPEYVRFIRSCPFPFSPFAHGAGMSYAPQLLTTASRQCFLQPFLLVAGIMSMYATALLVPT